VAGPTSEAAQFVQNPPPVPATYTLSITANGLGSGLTWGAAVGTTGGSGVGAVNLTGLNGTYTLTVPIVGAGQGVQYVAHRAQAQDQQFFHWRRRSEVEWSLGSPTIATRPPYSATTSRSGTVSAV